MIEFVLSDTKREVDFEESGAGTYAQAQGCSRATKALLAVQVKGRRPGGGLTTAGPVTLWQVVSPRVLQLSFHRASAGCYLSSSLGPSKSSLRVSGLEQTSS